MSESKYNKSIFLFIIVVLLVLVAYTIVSLMEKEESSVVDSISDQIETNVDTTQDYLNDLN